MSKLLIYFQTKYYPPTGPREFLTNVHWEYDLPATGVKLSFSESICQGVRIMPSQFRLFHLNIELVNLENSTFPVSAVRIIADDVTLCKARFPLTSPAAFTSIEMYPNAQEKIYLGLRLVLSSVDTS
jgi:hypothetical protein